MAEAIEQGKQDYSAAQASGLFQFGIHGSPDDEVPLRNGGGGATAYGQAMGVYLACGVSRLVNRLATVCVWNKIGEKVEQVFARQAIPMTWDFPEVNPFSGSTGGWSGSLSWIPATIALLPFHTNCMSGVAEQMNATDQALSNNSLISTDPPYYDNIAYADLSDFFYVWLRRSLTQTFPDLFATLAVPKSEELVAAPYRHGTKEKAEAFFLNGMTDAMYRLSEQVHPGFPATIYYAFKQSEKTGETGNSRTGWETFLDAVIRSGFAISGTWPIRTERPTGVKVDTNVLASSIVLVCNRRVPKATLATRREYLAALREELPVAIANLRSGNIAPVDLAQAAIGPGMAVFTRYAKVLDAQGNRVSVGDALALINQTLDEVLAEHEGEFDPDTRWALAWFEQQGFEEGDFGVAETLSKAKNTSIDGIVEGGILASKGGKVRLLRPNEMASEWDPTADTRLTVWEAVHYLVHALETGGEFAAAELVHKIGGLAETARELAYRLYTICERKNRAEEARSYNGLVQSWPEIAKLARERAPAEQGDMFGGTAGTQLRN